MFKNYITLYCSKKLNDIQTICYKEKSLYQIIDETKLYETNGFSR